VTRPGVQNERTSLGWSHDRYRRAARAMREQRPVDQAVPALLLTLAVCLVGALGLALIVM
jgi:hypothetical protein